MAWPKKAGPTQGAGEKRTLGEGVFDRCKGCGATLTRQQLVENFEVCPKCEHHHRLEVDRWRELICDGGRLETFAETIRPQDPLAFVDDKPYGQRLASSQERTGHNDAIEVGRTAIEGIEVAYGCFVFSFMGGSMGSVVGERITRLFEIATEQKVPCVLLQASGGARMQEGILSLMQMAKCVAALERFKEAGLPFISCLLHPTTGGVAASFAFLGDVNIAEKGALIGFAGPRVIETTIRQTLPPGFQRAEFLLDHGMVDQVVSRLAMKSMVAGVLRHLWRS